MDYAQSPVKLPVENFGALVEQDKKEKRHGNSLLSSIQAVLSGPSGYGKTNSMLTLLTRVG